MNSLGKLEDVAYTVTEHTRAMREFKHDMSMKYHNTNNQDKRNRILEKIGNIESIMSGIHGKFVEEYEDLNGQGADAELLEKLKNHINEFYTEILSLK